MGGIALFSDICALSIRHPREQKAQGRPVHMALSPHVFTKLAPLWEQGIHILNYLDDWLIIAHSRDLLCKPSGASGHLGKKQTLPCAEHLFSWYGVGFGQHGSVPHGGLHASLLGHMAAAAAVTPLGLLHMRPLHHWLHGWIPRWAWHRCTFRVGVTPECHQFFSFWSDLHSYGAGMPLGQMSIINTNASETGWVAVCNGQDLDRTLTAVAHQLPRAAGSVSLRRFQPMLQGKHVLVRTDNRAMVTYINRQGGLCSCHMSQLACHLLLWSQTWLKSLRAVHIPRELNRAAYALS
ncbi:Carbohydrate sulfotransferase 11 [Labeo rohita]|uniref:Carbohydrate sulfotransferase 11 n=1 Tax=Labeo rohita TaxID=84645 RepID=A0ABQ8LIQ4_LABRO|nr:Carbohydrate sulfotransferase 11 [Labeo rohita]